MSSTGAADADLLRLAYGDSRSSAPRLVVARAVAALDGAFTVERLLPHVHAMRPGVGTATVYRAVAAMLANGFIERVGVERGRTLYLRCGSAGHHHHLVCTCCGSAAEAPCPIEPATLDAAAEAGFLVTGHDVTVYGLCSGCASARGGD